MKRLLPFLLLAFAGVVQAQVTCPQVATNKAHVCWTHDGKDTSGNAITGVTFTVQRQSGSTWVNEVASLTATDWTSGVLTPGSYTYRVLAVAGGVSSDPSSTASKTTTNPQPNPPGGVIIAQVTITISAPAYRVIGSYPNARRGDFVALVPMGRDCSGPVLFRKNGYSFRLVEVKSNEGWQDAGPTPRVAAAPCVRIGS